MHVFCLCYHKGSYSLSNWEMIQQQGWLDSIRQIHDQSKKQAQKGKGTFMQVYMVNADCEGSLFSKALFVSQAALWWPSKDSKLCMIVITNGLETCLVDRMEKTLPDKETVYAMLQVGEIVACYLEIYIQAIYLFMYKIYICF